MSLLGAHECLRISDTDLVFFGFGWGLGFLGYRSTGFHWMYGFKRAFRIKWIRFFQRIGSFGFSGCRIVRSFSDVLDLLVFQGLSDVWFFGYGSGLSFRILVGFRLLDFGLVFRIGSLSFADTKMEKREGD